MKAPAQREVAVKKRSLATSTTRTLAFSLCLLLATPAWAADDAPVVLQYPNGSALMNKAAFDHLDSELKRLQQVEREHKAEPSWATPVIIGGVVGLVVGVVASVVVVGAVKAK